LWLTDGYHRRHDGPDEDPSDAPYARLVTFRRGLVARCEAFADRSEALEAVGLRE